MKKKAPFIVYNDNLQDDLRTKLPISGTEISVHPKPSGDESARPAAFATAGPGSHLPLKT